MPYRNKEARTLTFGQNLYAETVAKRFDVTKTSMILIATEVKARSTEGAHNRRRKEVIRRIPYRETIGGSHVGSYQVKRTSRLPHLAQPKFCDDTEPVHWKAAMKALQYFRRTKRLGVTYGEVACGRLLHRSVPVEEILFGGGAVSWFSRTQRVTTSRSSESEYITLTL